MWDEDCEAQGLRETMFGGKERRNLKARKDTTISTTSSRLGGPISNALGPNLAESVEARQRSGDTAGESGLHQILLMPDINETKR